MNNDLSVSNITFLYNVYMKNAIILHGSTDSSDYFDVNHPSMSNSHWLPWLQKQLLLKGILAQTPEMPNPVDGQMIYEEWKKMFERFPINEDTILVGHSTGAGFLSKWLSENSAVNVDKVVLVAPWIDPNNIYDKDFFACTFDPDLASRTKGLFLFVSQNDDSDVLLSVSILMAKIDNIQLSRFKDLGHFTEEGMGKTDFPELLDVIIS